MWFDDQDETPVDRHEVVRLKMQFRAAQYELSNLRTDFHEAEKRYAERLGHFVKRASKLTN